MIQQRTKDKLIQRKKIIYEFNEKRKKSYILTMYISINNILGIMEKNKCEIHTSNCAKVLKCFSFEGKIFNMKYLVYKNRLYFSTQK